jgi:hypothetical protein
VQRQTYVRVCEARIYNGHLKIKQNHLYDNAAMLAIHPLSVPVAIKDVKEAFGRTEPCGPDWRRWTTMGVV